jgi:hypothetical protein
MAKGDGADCPRPKDHPDKDGKSEEQKRLSLVYHGFTPYRKSGRILRRNASR